MSKDIHKFKAPFISNPSLLSTDLNTTHSDLIEKLLATDFNATYTTVFKETDYTKISQIADSIKTIEPQKYKMSPEMQNFVVKYLVRNRATYVRVFLMLLKIQVQARKTISTLSDKMENAELEEAKAAVVSALASQPDLQKKVKNIFSSQQTEFQQLGKLIADLQKNNNSLSDFVHKVIPTVTNWLDSSDPVKDTAAAI